MTISLIESIFYNILSIFISSGIIAFIIKNFIKTKIEQSIKHAYDKKLEEFKQEQLIRYKAEVVAELFAEWLDRPEDNKRLNQLTFQAFLWLPDDICNDLNEVLTHTTNDKTFRNIIHKTRKHLLKETNLDALKVVNFLKKTSKNKGEI
ncbi:hypothetical protein ACOL21_04170 [Aliarcobacter butzleri]